MPNRHQNNQLPPHSIVPVDSKMHLNKEAVNEKIDFVQFPYLSFHETDETNK